MEVVLEKMKALSDKNRLRVVAALMENEELCVCQITEMLGIATPTVSRHMSILLGASLVESRKEGRWVYYSLSAAFPNPLLRWVDDSLANSASLASDRQKLSRILRCEPEELCRQQKEK